MVTTSLQYPQGNADESAYTDGVSSSHTPSEGHRRSAHRTAIEVATSLGVLLFVARIAANIVSETSDWRNVLGAAVYYTIFIATLVALHEGWAVLQRYRADIAADRRRLTERDKKSAAG
jgi:hypothetical protein